MTEATPVLTPPSEFTTVLADDSDSSRGTADLNILALFTELKLKIEKLEVEIKKLNNRKSYTTHIEINGGENSIVMTNPPSSDDEED